MKKTEVMVISKNDVVHRCQITINNAPVKQVSQFTYLGCLISEDARSEIEIKKRIGMAKRVFQRIQTLITNSHISKLTRARLMEAYSMYG